MINKISAVVNTYNEEKNLAKALESVKWADEIIVCDMHSEDKTVEIAKKYKAKVFFHERTGFVEPARNFAISKASGDWILVLDADEEIPKSLAEQLKSVAEGSLADFVEIPRKNIIFGKWMKASMWWPDYKVRFFKKKMVIWSEKIHIPPQASGKGITLPPSEESSFTHYHYSNIFQFVERMNRYTDVQAKELKDGGYIFKWEDMIKKPLGEFLGRFFANRGFEDGLHGLALGLLQAFSFLVMYLKVWEMEKFQEKDINWPELKSTIAQSGEEIDYWIKTSSLSKNPVKRAIQKVTNKFT